MSEKEQQTAEPGAGKQTQEGGGAAGGNAELEGIKKNRDDILKEKRELQKRLEALETENKAREAKAAEEQGKFKELYEKAKTEAETIKTASLERIKAANLKIAAALNGFNVEYLEAIKGVEFTDDGELVDAKTFFKELKEKKPLFFTDAGNQSPVGVDSKKTAIHGTGTQQALTKDEHKDHVTKIRTGYYKEKPAEYEEVNRRLQAFGVQP